MNNSPDVEAESRADFVHVFAQQRLADRRLASIIQSAIGVQHQRASAARRESAERSAIGEKLDQQHQNADLTLLQASFADDREQTHRER